jgi:hypothetical protein
MLNKSPISLPLLMLWLAGSGLFYCPQKFSKHPPKRAKIHPGCAGNILYKNSALSVFSEPRALSFNTAPGSNHFRDAGQTFPPCFFQIFPADLCFFPEEGVTPFIFPDLPPAIREKALPRELFPVSARWQL